MIRSWILPGLLLAAVLSLNGCKLVHHYFGERTPNAVSLTSAWRAPPVDGRRVRRVIVLPFHDDADHPHEVAAMRRQFMDALNRRQVFDVVPLPPALLNGTDETEFLRRGEIRQATILRMSEKYHADGVLFGTVTRLHSYEPMVIGLRVSLVSAGAGDLIWEANGFFDASDDRVARDVHHFYDRRLANNDAIEGWRSILASPKRFRDYVATRIVDTW